MGVSFTVSAKAKDNVGVTSLTLSANGTPVALVPGVSGASGTATLSFNTPGQITLAAAAGDAAGNAGTSTATEVVVDPSVTQAPVATITSPSTGTNITAPRGARNRSRSSLRTTAACTVTGNLKLGALNLSFTDMTVPSIGIPITITRTYSSLTANSQGDFGYGWTLSMSNTTVQVVHQNGTVSDFGDYVPMENGDRVIVRLPGGTVDRFTFEAQPNTAIGDSSSGFLAVLDYVPTFVPDVRTHDQLLVNNVSLQQVGDEYVNLETGDSYNPALPEFGNNYTLQLHNGTQLVMNATTGDLNQIINRNNNTLTFGNQGIESSSGQSVLFTRDQAGRILSITSSGNQTVSYQYDSSGDLISFTDAGGNITQYTYLDTPAHYLNAIIGPNGVQEATAQYDSSGRVSSLTDANGNADNLTYDLSAKKQTMVDAQGNASTTYYDSDGNPIEVVNVLGGVTLNTYDANDDLLSTTAVTGEGNLTTTYTYDQNGDPLSVTSPDGTTMSTTYNPFGRPLTQTDSLGNITRYNYYANGSLLSVTDAQGNVARYTYDNQGNLVSATDTQGNATHFSYDGQGNVISETDLFGTETSFSYDNQGHQTGTSYNWVNPNNPSDVRPVTSGTNYDTNGNPIDVTDAAGHTVAMTYTPNGKVATTTAANGDVTQDTYDAKGELIEIRQQSEDSNGSTKWTQTRSVYDANGHVIAQTDPYVEGTTAAITGTLTSYDGLGDATQTQSVTGIAISLTGSGNTMSSILASSGTVVTTTSTQYDNQGREISSINQFGHETLTTYDRYGRVVDTRTQSVDQNGNVVWLVTQTVYNGQGEAELTTDPYQQGSSQPIDATETIYDSLGHSVQTIQLQGVQVGLFNANTGQSVDPLNPGNAAIVSEVTNWGIALYSTKSVYNSLGQLTESTAPDGEVTQYEYNSLGQQTATVGQPVNPSSVGLSIPAGDPAGTLVSLRTETTYDDYGNTNSQTTNIHEFVLPNGTTQLDDTNAQITGYQYDQFGALIKTIYPDSSTAVATYDNNGNQTSMTDRAGLTTRYQYDAENRLASVAMPAVTDPATGGLVRVLSMIKWFHLLSAASLVGLLATPGCGKKLVGYHIVMVNKTHGDLERVDVLFDGKMAAESGHLVKGGLASFGFVFLPIPEAAEVRWIDERHNPAPKPKYALDDYSAETVRRLSEWIEKGEPHSPKVKLTGIVPKEPAHMNIYFIIEDDSSVTVKCIRSDDREANQNATKGIEKLREKPK